MIGNDSRKDDYVCERNIKISGLFRIVPELVVDYQFKVNSE